MTSENGQKRDKKQYFLNLALAAVAGQVGCLTLVIILTALFLGLWLDSRFDTRPVITLVLVFGSLPVTLIMMFVVVRGATKRIKHGTFNTKEKSQDETSEGGKSF
jgi:hypothetical protein